MEAASSPFQYHPEHPLLPATTDSSLLKETKKRKPSSTTLPGFGEKKGKYVKKEKGEISAPEDYIHVRARRGQATDSHSIAERVRREKISERMKLLQSLVPGCQKVSGKALMLDEIITYVQSLQNQVELLSMKLASVNPMPCDFGIDIDPFMISSVQQTLNFSMDNHNGYKYNSGQGTFINSTPFEQMLAPSTLISASSRSTWEEGYEEIEGIMMNDTRFNHIF